MRCASTRSASSRSRHRAARSGVAEIVLTDVPPAAHHEGAGPHVFRRLRREQHARGRHREFRLEKHLFEIVDEVRASERRNTSDFVEPRALEADITAAEAEARWIEEPGG